MAFLSAVACLAATAIPLLLAAPARGAPGDLDGSFGLGGKVTIAVGPRHANVNAAVAQPDGKLVVAGFAEQSASSPFNRDFLVARLNPNGSLDGSFNPTGPQPGVVTTPIGTGTADDTAFAITLGPAGTIYVVGTTDPPSEFADLVVVRYTSAGIPDTGFSSDGIQVHSTGSVEGAVAAGVQPDGRLVIAGFHGSSEGGMLVAALDGTTGALDPTFNAAGPTPGIREIVFTPGFGVDRANAMVLQPDGKILVAGTANQSSPDDDVALARLNGDGTLDTAGFGAGSGTVRAGPAKDQGLALALAPGGKPMVVGNSTSGGPLDFLLARFNPDGSVDNSFSGDGIETTAFPAPDGTRSATATSVAVQPDGGVLAGGHSFQCGGADCSDFAAARYNDDGSLDASFGDAGKRTYAVGSANDFAKAGVLNGGLSLVGFSFDGTREQLAAIRIAEAVDQYRIELKAWIPHGVVVDPVRPGEIPFVLGFLGDDCFDPGVRSTEFRTTVESLLNGNGHVPYDGSFKALAVAEFAWDGREITNFNQAGEFGETIRFLEYTVEDPVRRTARLVRCVANTGQATREAMAEKVGPNTVVSRISTAIPVIPLAPPIDGDLTSVVSGTPPESQLSLNYTSDLFPSHGYRVYKNGVLQSTETVSDASCLSATEVRGLTGASLLGWGLSHEENRGTAAVGPRDVGRVGSRPSLLCNKLYLLSRAIEEGSRARGLLARASRAPSLSVASVDSRGRPGRFMSLAQADARGLVDHRREGDAVAILADPAVPVALRLRGRRPALVVRSVDRGEAGAARVYRGRRDLTVTQGTRVRARSRGRAVRARNADRRPPKTTVTVQRRGRRAILRFRVRDRSAIAALDVLLNGKRVKVRRGQARVPVRQLSRVRFRSVDVFGNAERLKALGRR